MAMLDETCNVGGREMAMLDETCNVGGRAERPVMKPASTKSEGAVRNWAVICSKQQKQDAGDGKTLRTLFPLVPGDVRTACLVDLPVIDHAPPAAEDDGAAGEQGSACLELFPLAPERIVRGNASGAAPMDVDVSAGDPLAELRLFR